MINPAIINFSVFMLGKLLHLYTTHNLSKIDLSCYVKYVLLISDLPLNAPILAGNFLIRVVLRIFSKIPAEKPASALNDIATPGSCKEISIWL